MELIELLEQALESPTGIRVAGSNRIALRTFVSREISKHARFSGLTCIFSPINAVELIIISAALLEKQDEG
jgi:hypothetical protein